MIGQTNNINALIQWRINKSIPRFIIISGNHGSGRLTFAKEVIKTLNAKGVILGNSVDDVRNAINNAYTIKETTIYIFRDVDDMRNEAKNALLKVVEEPPNKAYFIMTVRNIDNMLGTIKSRGTQIKMEPYSLEEKQMFSTDKILLTYCSNIGQMKELDMYQLQLAIKTTNKIMQGLQDKSGTDVLEACTALKAKQTETDKLDCELFLNVFEKELNENIVTRNIIENIEVCRYELQHFTINKKFSIECMLLRILEDIKHAEISTQMG